MEEYHKIETLFEREETGRHNLIIGKYRNPAVGMCKDLKWVFTEKIDGTNIRIHWDGHKVEIGGRTNNANLPVDLVNLLNKKFCTVVVEQVFEQKFGEKEVYLYGEGYGAGIQKGGGYRKDKGFILFDVRVGREYLSYEDMSGIGIVFGCDIVPISLKGTIDEGVEYVKNTQYSQVGDGTQVLEGIVGRLSIEMFNGYGERMIIKIKKVDLV